MSLFSNPIDSSHGFYFNDLTIGMTDSYSKTITETDIVDFARISGDTNPLHLSEEFARTTRFKSRISHGILTASLISTVIGTRLPGPGSIYITQMLRFKAPVRIGDKATASVTVKQLIPEKKIVELKTICKVSGIVVLDGEATAIVPIKNVSETGI